VKWADASWKIEHDHQGIKQYTGIERCQCRKAIAQLNHIGLAIRAFLRLESHAFHTGYSWMETKKQLLRDAIQAYLEKPWIRLIPRPSAQVLGSSVLKW
jgi:putative transposase